jgi:hypothetical protein
MKKNIALDQLAELEKEVPESELYTSNSSIDKEPKEHKETVQESLPGIEDEIKNIAKDKHERLFVVEMKLSLAPKGSKPIQIPVCAGEYNSIHVVEVLHACLNSRRIKTVIEAILDNPEPKTKAEKPAEVVVPMHSEDKDFFATLEQEQAPNEEAKEEIIDETPLDQLDEVDNFFEGND